MAWNFDIVTPFMAGRNLAMQERQLANQEAEAEERKRQRQLDNEYRSDAFGEQKRQFDASREDRAAELVMRDVNEEQNRNIRRAEFEQQGSRDKFNILKTLNDQLVTSRLASDKVRNDKNIGIELGTYELPLPMRSRYDELDSEVDKLTSQVQSAIQEAEKDPNKTSAAFSAVSMYGSNLASIMEKRNRLAGYATPKPPTKQEVYAKGPNGENALAAIIINGETIPAYKLFGKSGVGDGKIDALKTPSIVSESDRNTLEDIFRKPADDIKNDGKAKFVRSSIEMMTNNSSGRGVNMIPQAISGMFDEGLFDFSGAGYGSNDAVRIVKDAAEAGYKTVAEIDLYEKLLMDKKTTPESVIDRLKQEAVIIHKKIKSNAPRGEKDLDKVLKAPIGDPIPDDYSSMIQPILRARMLRSFGEELEYKKGSTNAGTNAQ